MAAGRAHRRPRGRHQRCTASYSGRRGLAVPARLSAKVKTVAGGGRGLRPRCRSTADHRPGRRSACSGWPSASRSSAARSTCWTAARPSVPSERRARRRPAVGHARARSSRSAPSCCSARSSTPTRRGSASSSRSPASTRTSRPRSATTSTASSPALRLALARSDAVDRVRRARAHPGRHHPGRHRRGDGRRARARPDMVRADPRDVRAPGPARWPTTTSARPTCRRGPRHRAGAGDRARADLPGRRQGHLRRARACPHEMKEMVERAVIPDLQARAGAAAVIVSRTLRTWGERRVGAGRAAGRRGVEPGRGRTPRSRSCQRHRGHQGPHHGQGARRGRRAAAARRGGGRAPGAARRPRVRRRRRDDGGGRRSTCSRTQGLTLGVAESVTGGLVGSRLTDVPGSSEWFRGSIVAYASEVKFDLLGVPEGPVVSRRGGRGDGRGRAQGARAPTSGSAVTGVAGPDRAGGPAGRHGVHRRVDLDGDVTVQMRTSRRPHRVRQFVGDLPARPPAPPAAHGAEVDRELFVAVLAARRRARHASRA